MNIQILAKFFNHYVNILLSNLTNFISRVTLISYCSSRHKLSDHSLTPPLSEVSKTDSLWVFQSGIILIGPHTVSYMFVKFGDVLAFPTDSYVVPFGLGPLFRILMELIFVLKLASRPGHTNLGKKILHFFCSNPEGSWVHPKSATAAHSDDI